MEQTHPDPGTIVLHADGTPADEHYGKLQCQHCDDWFRAMGWSSHVSYCPKNPNRAEPKPRPRRSHPPGWVPPDTLVRCPHCIREMQRRSLKAHLEVPYCTVLRAKKAGVVVPDPQPAPSEAPEGLSEPNAGKPAAPTRPRIGLPGRPKDSANQAIHDEVLALTELLFADGVPVAYMADVARWQRNTEMLVKAVRGT